MSRFTSLAPTPFACYFRHFADAAIIMPDILLDYIIRWFCHYFRRLIITITNIYAAFHWFSHFLFHWIISLIIIYFHFHHLLFADEDYAIFIRFKYHFYQYYRCHFTIMGFRLLLVNQCYADWLHGCASLASSVILLVIGLLLLFAFISAAVVFRH